MRKKALIIMGMLCMLVFSSCTQQNFINNLRIDFKEYKMSENGYAAVVYGDRLYYVSNEYGTSGIYSMELDGSDVVLEAENPDIIGLQIQDGILYYNGLFQINEGPSTDGTGAINQHTLYYTNLSEGTPRVVNYVEAYNLKEFYITKKGYLFCVYGALLSDLYLYDSTQKESYSNIKNKITTISFKYPEIQEYESNNTNGKTDSEDNMELIQVNVYKFGDSIIFGKPLPIEEELNRFINESPYALNENSGELMVSYDRGQSEAFKALYMDEDYIYCAYNGMIIILKRNSYQIETMFIPQDLSNGYLITYMAKYDNTVYVVADYWRNQGERYLPLLGEKLFVINPDNFECKEVLDLGSEQRIIGLDNDHIIFLDNGAIYRINIKNGEIGERSKICYAPGDIDTKNYTIDYAGNWMFIYKIYPENSTDSYGSNLPGEQLIMKINLENGDVVYNDVELDFSELDPYKEK